MNVVDSSGWLEYFAEGPKADFFAAAIENTVELIVPSISVYEVFKRISQQRDEHMADSVILATARAFGATLWTQDEHFKSVEGVRYIAKER